MKRLLLHLHYLLVLLGLVFPTIVKAGIWENPKISVYYSENKEFKLIITPKNTSDKYNMWNYYKSNKHPQTKKIIRKKEKFMRNISAQDTIYNPCTAELYRMKGNDSLLIWNRALLNDVCPVYAIVANDGSSIATFDNWYSSGYSVNVFVVYNEKGEAKRTYKLEEISPFPLNDYLSTFSSIMWRDKVEYVENDEIVLVFKTRDNRKTTMTFNTKEFEFKN